MNTSIKMLVIALLVLVCATAGCLSKRSPDLNSGQSFAVRSEEKTCQTSDDCVLFAADCCGCNQGGKQTAVNKKNLDALTSRKQSNCANVACIQVISDDPSCKATSAACTNGSCVIQN